MVPRAGGFLAIDSTGDHLITGRDGDLQIELKRSVVYPLAGSQRAGYVISVIMDGGELSSGTPAILRCRSLHPSYIKVQRGHLAPSAASAAGSNRHSYRTAIREDGIWRPSSSVATLLRLSALFNSKVSELVSSSGMKRTKAVAVMVCHATRSIARVNPGSSGRRCRPPVAALAPVLRTRDRNALAAGD